MTAMSTLRRAHERTWWISPLIVGLVVQCNVARGQELEWNAPSELPSFSVVSVKVNESFFAGPSSARYTPGRFSASRVALSRLLAIAYSIPTLSQIVGVSSAFESMTFDVEGRSDGSRGNRELRLMLQRALIERFKLRGHVERRRMPVFALVAAGQLPKSVAVTPAKECQVTGANGQPELDRVRCGHLAFGTNMLIIDKTPMSQLATAISQAPQFTGLDRLVIDMTGLADLYSARLAYSAPAAVMGLRQEPSADLPDLSTALKEQLGVRLERREELVDVLVVDRVERPDPN